MYINKVHIKNIRAIESFEMNFDEGLQEGWHVIIGENGAGKSTIVKAIALAIIGPNDSKSLRLNLNEWIRKNAREESSITLLVKKHDVDSKIGQSRTLKDPIKTELTIKTDSLVPYLQGSSDSKAGNYIWSNAKGWFSSAFGPFRRFTGGEKEWMKVYYSDPRAAAHLSVFGEDVALTEAIDWLKELNYKKLEKSIGQYSQSSSPENDLIDHLKQLLNEGGLLPHGTKIKQISSEGVFFTDGYGYDIDVTQLSDGFRSLLSLTFELLRQLVRCYGQDEVFKNFPDSLTIDLPGVVLIDEIDAHLHPTWQTRIGKWFTSCFPKLQFIVTTHSPLICRASDKGSIWFLAAPGSQDSSRKLEGDEKHRLVFGDILDAYSTEAFGQNVTQSQAGQDLTKELAELSMKSFKGSLQEKEKQRLNELKSILPTAML